MSDDVAKVAVPGIPAVIYMKDNTIWVKVLNVCLLLLIIYVFLLVGRILRKAKTQQAEQGE